MRYGMVFPYAGARPLQEYFQPANDVGYGTSGMSNLAAGTTPLFMPQGVIVAGYDNYWGAVEFLYAQANGVIGAWQLASLLPALVGGRIIWQATATLNAANQVRPLCVAIQQMAAGQFGWFAVGGLVPIQSAANVAASTPLGIAAVGQAGADSAGKEILNAINVLPSTTTVVKNCLVRANSPQIICTGNNTIDGVFIGCAVSGAGIPANAVVQTLDPDGRTFTISTGPGVAGAALNATASGGVALTFTYNDGTNFYNVAHINRPAAQGRIT